MKTITTNELEMFNALNDLRESGTTNMLGAGSFLRNVFEVNKIEARITLAKWMENFNTDGYDHLTIEK